jgi:hypothetical protein
LSLSRPRRVAADARRPRSAGPSPSPPAPSWRSLLVGGLT